MSQSSFRASSMTKDAASRQHQLAIPSNAHNVLSLTIPRMDAGSEHFVQILIGKMETNLCFPRPYFEAFVPASQAALAAAAAAAVKNKHPEEDQGPPSSYVSELMKQRAGLILYFGTNPPDAKNLTTYDWTESVASSRRKRLKSAVAGGQRGAGLAAEMTASIAVGPAVDSDDDDEPAPRGSTEDQPLTGSRTDSSGNDGKQSPATKHRQMDANHDVVFGISQVQNCFYVGVYAPIALRNVDITVVVNGAMKARDDVRHPLRMCRMHTVCGETFDAAVDWIAKKRTMLVQGLLSLTVDSCEASVASGFLSGPNAVGSCGADGRRTFLHEIMEHLGDPRFARMLLKHCSRFLKKDDKELATGRTPLHTIFVAPMRNNSRADDWYARVAPVGSCEYYRMLELLRLLVEEANVSLTEEDIFGNTAVHYAACGHRLGSELLPVLLMMGAPATSVNLRGHRPVDELLARQNAHEQLTWDVDEALALLQTYGSPSKTVVSCSEDASARGDAVAIVEAGDVSSGAVAGEVAERRRHIAEYIGHGVDLPRNALKLVDVVPMKVHPFGSDSSKRQFPTPVVAVDASGYPVLQTVPAAATDSTPTAAIGKSYIAPATLALLQDEFSSLDREGNGWITVSDMRRAYLSFDGYGVAESTAEIDKTISVMGIRKDGLVSFDEYCVLMLRMNRL